MRWLERSQELDGKIPARQDFPPHKFGALMSHVVVFDVLEPLDFKYSLFGTAVRENAHGEYTGKLLSSLPGKGPDSGIWTFLTSVLKEQSPQYYQIPYVGPTVSIKGSTALFFPLAKEYKTIDKIFLVTQFIR